VTIYEKNAYAADCVPTLFEIKKAVLLSLFVEATNRYKLVLQKFSSLLSVY